MEVNINYSFIVPHKNCPDLLRRCVDSIPQRNDVQIIVVDDNSDEDKKPNLDRKDVEVILLDAEHSKGAGRARNMAIPRIRGRKVIFADSDDFFVGDFSEILDDYANDEAELIFFNTKGAFSEDLTRESNRNKNHLFAEYHRTGNMNLFRYRYSEPWGKIYSANLIKANNITFDETIVANDYMFSVKAGVYAKTIKAIDIPLYIVTVRENSLSYKSLDTKEKLMARFYVQARVQVFLQNHGYCKNEMLILGLAINMSHRYPFTFISKLFWLQKIGINVLELLKQIIRKRVLNKSGRKNISIKKEAYRSI